MFGKRCPSNHVPISFIRGRNPKKKPILTQYSPISHATRAALGHVGTISNDAQMKQRNVFPSSRIMGSNLQSLAGFGAGFGAGAEAGELQELLLARVVRFQSC